MLPSQRKQQRDDEDVGGENHEIHDKSDAHEIGEAITTFAIHHHVGGRTDRRGETGRDCQHQRYTEGDRIHPERHRSLVGYGIEHGGGSGVADELRDEGAHKAYGDERYQRIRSAEAHDAAGKCRGDACMVNGGAQAYGTCKYHQNVPVDGIVGLLRRAALGDEHGKGCQEACLQEREYIEGGKDDHPQIRN